MYFFRRRQSDQQTRPPLPRIPQLPASAIEKRATLPSRQLLQFQIISALHTDVSLTTLLTPTIQPTTATSPHPQTQSANLTRPSHRPFPYGVSRASDTLSLSILSHRSNPPVRTPDPPPAATSCTIAIADIQSPHHGPSHSFSTLPDSPGHESPTRHMQLPAGSTEESAHSAQLSNVRAPARRHARTFAHLPRHTVSPTPFNPFATEMRPAPPNSLDVLRNLTLDTIMDNIPIIQASLQMPFSDSASFPADMQFVGLCHGQYARGLPFIFESGGRIWQEEATWRKEVRGVRAITEPVSVLSLCGRARWGGHASWSLVMGSVLGRMLAVSAGLQERGHECLRAVIAMQAIREMLRVRAFVRSVLRFVCGGAECFVDMDVFGTFAVTRDGWLVVDGCERADMALLDPTGWRSVRDVSRALVAWTNVETDVVGDARDLLASVRLSVRSVSHWCRIALQFAGAHDVESAIAFVGVIRFLFVRRWAPKCSQAGVHADDDLLCANELVDAAVGVPELETCLPAVLGMEGVYSGGHEFDCGALTCGEVVRAAWDGNRREIRGSWLKRWSGSEGGRFGEMGGMDGGSVSSWSVGVVKGRRIVMSVWTDELCGAEWCIPRVSCLSVDFRVGGLKYRVAVDRGDVVCQRVGARVWRRRKKRTGGRHERKDQVDGDGDMNVDVDLDVDVREASGSAAICNAFDRVYGDEVCFQVLGWLQRGLVRLNDMCSAASFIPRRCLGGLLVVNRKLPFEVCRRMVFGRRGHELYWIPGDGLPCFRVCDRPDGCYQLTEIMQLPVGVELCRAEISKDFG